MNNLPIQTYESVVQQRDELLVELHNLKSAITERINLNEEIKNAGMPPHSDFWHQSIYMADKKVKEALSDTPATDSFLAEVQAHGVDKLAIFAGNEYQRFVGDKPTQRKWKGVVMLCTGFAAQLRRGINDAQ